MAPAELAVVLEATQVSASEVVSVVHSAAAPPVVPVAPVALRSVSVALHSVLVVLRSWLADQRVLASGDFLVPHSKEPDMFLLEAFPLASEEVQVVPEWVQVVRPGPALPPLVHLDLTELALLDALLWEASDLARVDLLMDHMLPSEAPTAILVATVTTILADMAEVSTVTHMASVMATAITLPMAVMVTHFRDLLSVSSLLALEAAASALDLVAHKYL